MNTSKLAVILLSIVLCTCRQADSKTSSAASRSDVQFIALPSSANHIRYWSDKYANLVTFSVGEEDFRLLFPQQTFTEISASDPKYYPDQLYGDPSRPPFKSKNDAKTMNGLFFEKWQPNGGGITLIYDRDRQQAFVSYIAW